MKTVYYAHSIGLYGTEQERRDVEMLQAMRLNVVNPNSPEHDAGYRQQGMAYFERWVKSCSMLAFRANPDGSINAGVALEIQWMRELERPVIELPGSILRRALTREQTREHLREEGAR